MAIMVDEKNTKYEGEAYVWECLSKNLSNDAVVYFNREIQSRTYDFCVLLENKGVLIIEVKGWRKDIIHLETPDKIWIKGYDTPQKSPRKQAYMYQYELRELFLRECNVKPLYFNMVCYPFLTSADFKALRLDLVSPEKYTILAEDISDSVRLQKKIDAAYEREKGDLYQPMTSEIVSAIRKYYEPHYLDMDTGEDIGYHYYSILRAIPGKFDPVEAKTIIKEYFNGTREILFLEDKAGFVDFIHAINAGYQRKNIEPEKDNVRLGYKNGVNFSEINSSFRAFNMEIYFVSGLSEEFSTTCKIIEGHCNDSDTKHLEYLQSHSSFNLAHYQIEHGTEEKNILVQAGAGTGKTFSMVSRIAYLCNKSIHPVKDIVHEIAMVTFTNDATANMKSRIRQMFMNYYVLTGNSSYIHYIEDVNYASISTIHKFALSILRKMPIETGLSTEFDIGQDIYYRRILYKNYLNKYIEDKTVMFPKYMEGFRVPLDTFVSTIINFADKISDKSIDINTISVEEMGVPKNNIVPDFTDIIVKVIQPAEKDYQDHLKNRDSISMNMCLMMLHDVIRETLKNKKELSFLSYRYIFIDEFQDTDNVQIDTFKELQKAIPEKIACKLFVVGDLKQSIYRFRGATVSAFTRLIGERSDLWQTYTLNVNYRTDKHLLDRYDTIFQRLGQKGLLTYESKNDRLISNVDYRLNPEDQFVCIQCHTKDDNAFFDSLFDTISTKKKELADIATKQDLNPNERTIAILTRTNWQVQNIMKEAKNRNVIIDAQVSNCLYNLPSTIDFYKLILALCNPNNSIYLTNFIHSNYVNLKLDYNQLHGKTAIEKTDALIGILDQYFKFRMGISFERVVQNAYEQPILKVLHDIYDHLMPWKNYAYVKTGVDEDRAKNLQNYYMANYDYLIERIIQECSIEELTLNQINSFLNIKVKTKQNENARDVEEDTSEIRVVCSTVHKSKGLEYGTVILPYTSADLRSERSKKIETEWSGNGLSYFIRFDKHGDEYNSFYDDQSSISEQINDETRILYVAMTRAIREFIWFKDLDNEPADSWGNYLESDER